MKFPCQSDHLDQLKSNPTGPSQAYGNYIQWIGRQDAKT